jgi:hypothetical protein
MHLARVIETLGQSEDIKRPTSALLGGLLWLPLGQWLATVAYLFLAWLTEGARLFAAAPYAAVLLPAFPLWLLLAYYAIVVGGWLWNAYASSTEIVELKYSKPEQERSEPKSATLAMPHTVE